MIYDVNQLVAKAENYILEAENAISQLGVNTTDNDMTLMMFAQTMSSVAQSLLTLSFVYDDYEDDSEEMMPDSLDNNY